MQKILTYKSLLIYQGILLSIDLGCLVRISIVISQSTFSTGSDKVIYPVVLHLVQWKGLRTGRGQDCPFGDSVKSRWPKVKFYTTLNDSEPSLSPGLQNLHLDLQRDSSERLLGSTGENVRSPSQPHACGGLSMCIFGPEMIIYPLLLSTASNSKARAVRQGFAIGCVG